MDATLPPPPVMEAGQAGPPGKMTATSKLPKGVDGSIMPVKGFAGAPGEKITNVENCSFRQNLPMITGFCSVAPPNGKSSNSLKINMLEIPGKKIPVFHATSSLTFRVKHCFSWTDAALPRRHAPLKPPLASGQSSSVLKPVYCVCWMC